MWRRRLLLLSTLSPFALLHLSSSPLWANSARDASEDLQDQSDHSRQILIISGTSNRPLAERVAHRLERTLANTVVGRYADGEVSISITDNIRGKDVYVIQSISHPVNDNLMELCLLVSALRRSSADRITAIIPYYGYGRQDRLMGKRQTIAAADVATMLESVGVDHVVAVDLHRGQIQGFFDVNTPVDNLSAVRSVIVPHLLETKDLHRPVVVSSSQTGAFRAFQFREELRSQGIETGFAFAVPQSATGRELELIDEDHHSMLETSQKAILVGDVRECDVIIADDMIDTGSRMAMAAEAAQQSGANRVFGFATHAILSSEESVKKLEEAPFTQIITTDSINGKYQSDLFETVTISGLIASAIVRLHSEKSLGSLTGQRI